MSDELRQRFFQNVELLPTGCWLWTGGVDVEGYGRMTFRTVRYSAMRVSFELFARPLRAGEKVFQVCETHRCINWRHLKAGSQFDIIAHRDKTGRGPRGLKNGKSSGITEDVVREIRRQSAEAKACGRKPPYAALAAQLEVCRSTVRDIDIGKIWGWVQ